MSAQFIWRSARLDRGHDFEIKCVALTLCQLVTVMAASVTCQTHDNYVIMSAMTSQITSLTIVYSTVDSGTDQRKHQSSASLAFVRGIYRWLVNSPHKEPVTRKMFPFNDVIIGYPPSGAENIPLTVFIKLKGHMWLDLILGISPRTEKFSLIIQLSIQVP